ncbi:MAG: sigma-70 family RNA polymerase sigma factor [Anaerolineae bacterium]|nr:sigma-70 family RNA polymerase sigma factor [Anaerolineae bacterium]
MNDKTGLHVLIRRIAQGDKAAQAEFFDLTCSLLTQFVRKHFGSVLAVDDIDEIVDQSILQMFLQAPNYRGDHGDPSAWDWVYQITRNQALKWLKTMKREVRFPDASDDADVNEARLHKMILRYNPNLDSEKLEVQVVEKLLREKVMEIIEQLNPREKLILHLYIEEEWKLKQIATYLNITPARVTQIMQGIQRKCQRAAD